MEIHLRTEDSIRLTDVEPAFVIEPDAGQTLSPFHLLGASLAVCTYSVLHSYGEHAGIPLDGLAIDVAWEFGGDPFRVTAIDMGLNWPGLPSGRREAARRAAAQCTIHHTLAHDVDVVTRVAEAVE
jgi:uncharacterized OsmC-like protein